MVRRKRTSRCNMDQVVAFIDKADDFAIRKVIDAVIKRYSRVFPDWEVIFYSLHKEPKQRARDVRGLIRSLEISAFQGTQQDETQ